MNNNYFFSLLCITLLALAPACCKKSSSAKASADKQKEDVNTMIELDNTVFEIEEDNDDKKVSKF